MTPAPDYPVFRRPRLTAGVGAKTASMIWSIAALIAMTIGLPWGLSAFPIAAIIHKAASWFFRIDPEIVNLYMIHEYVPNDLKSGEPSHGEPSESRPKGWGKGVAI